MSDTDNESAFESADEGDAEDINSRAIHPQQESVGEEAARSILHNVPVAHHEEEKVKVEESKNENKAETSREEPGLSQFVEGNESEGKTGASGEELAGDVSQLPEDEGVGDWDGGWEVDEDVLAAPVEEKRAENSQNVTHEQSTDNNLVSQAKLSPPKELDCQEENDTKLQRESTPTRKIERSSKKKDVLDKLCEASGQAQPFFGQNVNNLPLKKQSSGWGWGNWGTSILSTASSSVATFTTQVGQGLNSVLESVEATLGAPTPEELAAQHALAKESTGESNSEENSSAAQDNNSQSQTFLVSPIAMSVGNISSKVIAGSLDTLELIGRKTMDILQEGDPGLKKKRSFLKSEKPVLSEVLREAKEREQTSLTNENESTKGRIKFSLIFEDCQGLIHLEALEMLSKHSEQQVQIALLSLIDDELKQMQSELENIKAIYESEIELDFDEFSDQEFEILIREHLESLKVAVNLEDILRLQSNSLDWMRQCALDVKEKKLEETKEICDKAILFMAEFTARAIEIIHKISELTLVIDNVEVQQAVYSFAYFSNVLCTELTTQSTKYCSFLSTIAVNSEDPDSVNPMITNVCLEASNCTTYIQDACVLLLPIFQLKCITERSNKES